MPHPAPLSDADFEAAHAAQGKARRKALWILAGSLALFLGLMLFAFAADEAPSDASDLRVTFRRPPETQNAYAQLVTLVPTLPPEPKSGTAEERHFTQILDDKVAWDQAVVAAVLGRYPPGLTDSVRSILDAPESEAPELKSYNDIVPEIGRFRSLGFFLTRQAALAWHAGDHVTAAELNLLALKLGKRISQSQGPLITVLTGTALENVALASIQKHADDGSITPQVLHSYLARIGQYELNPAAYHTAYKLEHVAFIRAAADLRTSSSVGTGLFGSGKKSLVWLRAVPGAYQPNRTIRWHADFVRASIAGDDPTRPAGMKTPEEQALADYLSAPWPGRAQNCVGRELLDIATPTIQVFANGHRSRATLRLTLVYVALRLYQSEHAGALPGTLDELVPAYLPVVPLDPFDGQPLHYSLALTTIWSVDRDRRTVTDSDGDLPRGMPAARLRFARPPVVLPAFAEEPAP